MIDQNIAINLLDILVFNQPRTHINTCKRNFAALSFRLRSDSKFISSGKQIPAPTDTVSLVPPYVEYEQTTDGKDTIIVMHFNVLNCVLNDIQVFNVPDPQKYKVLFERALSIWQSKSVGYKNEATAVFYQIMAQLQRDGMAMSEMKNKFLYEAEQYIRKNLGRSSLTVAELAQRACVSEAYFRRKFAQQFGMSPKKYIESARMNYAVSLLQAQYYTQQEISEMCGYSDVKYFRTAFKKYTGACLSKYKYIFD